MKTFPHIHFVVCVLGARRKFSANAERQLFDALTMNYDPGTRPVLQANTTLYVNFSISLHQIMDLVCTRLQ